MLWTRQVLGAQSAPPWLTARSTRQATFPGGAIIRTILADLPPDRLGDGATMFHEHLTGNYTVPPAARGAFIGFDPVGHEMTRSHIPEVQKIRMFRMMLDAGYEDHLLLSGDFAQASNIKANWGNGWSSVVLQFVPKLRFAGVKDETLHKILVDNPRRFLAFVPKSA